MICSNEPGFYKAGAFGIRIENLVVVTEPEDLGGDRPMMGFETITLVPIDLNLVDATLLTQAEKVGSIGITHGCVTRFRRWWMMRPEDG